jgi:DNA topoisomerase VI subunit B
MKTEIVEKLFEMAVRVPPGDNWKVVGVDKVQPSLTDALEAWFQVATVKPKAFRLDLVAGKLFAIIPSEVEIPEPEVKRYNIYGDYA